MPQRVCKVCFFDSNDIIINRVPTILRGIKGLCEYHSTLFKDLAFKKLSGRLPEQISVGFFWKRNYIRRPSGVIKESKKFLKVKLMYGNAIVFDEDMSSPPSAGISTLIAQTRKTHPDWIDLSQLIEFKRDCDCLHADCTYWPLRNIFTAKPQWLIDVHQWCIVPFPPGVDYIALSYVWGDINPLTTTKDNVGALCTPGALATPKFWNSIPKTVLHAITLTSYLREDYLWCDALCIVQDNENKHEELANMASIYVNAALTVIAANGDNSDHGLLGLAGISGPRSYSTRVSSLGEKLQYVAHTRDSHWSSTSAIWGSRAWTLQEFLFSRRQLIFYDNTVGWQCNHGARFEHVFWPNENVWAGPPFLSYTNGIHQLDFTNRIPDIEEMRILINGFNKLTLSYPEDALNAFAGLMTAFGKSFDGGFVSGLPTIYFNLALLWESRGAMKRRTPKNSTRNCCLPSWSWAGWEGGIEFPLEHSGNECIVFETGASFVRSYLVWRSHQTRDCIGTPIRFNWSLYRTDIGHNTSQPIPSGWTQYDRDDLDNWLSYCFGCGKLVRTEQSRHYPIPFTDFPWCLSDNHEFSRPSTRYRDMPNHIYIHSSQLRKIYKYPVAVPEVNYVPPITYAPFISCTTFRAWFQTGELNVGDYVIIDDGHESRRIGYLNQQVEVRSLDRLELIEIAQGPKNNEWYMGGSVDALYGSIDVYYVMWIKWEDGIAYRQGIGYILKDVWEAAEKEQIDVMLG